MIRILKSLWNIKKYNIGKDLQEFSGFHAF